MNGRVIGAWFCIYTITSEEVANLHVCTMKVVALSTLLPRVLSWNNLHKNLQLLSIKIERNGWTHMNKLIIVFLSSELLLLAKYITEQHTPIQEAHFIYSVCVNGTQVAGEYSFV